MKFDDVETVGNTSEAGVECIFTTAGDLWMLWNVSPLSAISPIISTIRNVSLVSSECYAYISFPITLTIRHPLTCPRSTTTDDKFM